jgi:hypothetical protein
MKSLGGYSNSIWRHREAEFSFFVIYTYRWRRFHVSLVMTLEMRSGTTEVDEDCAPMSP